MPRTYDARSLEARWSRRWDEDGCYRAPDLPVRTKFYNFDSGPFPNGPLHLGHVRTYVLGDVTARFQRACGKDVLYCLEWDAFGLPNEREARGKGISPAAFTARWIHAMQDQLRTLGVSYDWTRVRNTSDPDYYKWTQWLFLRMLSWGLVSFRRVRGPYCPECRTVLAQMQVVDDTCWRCHTPVIAKRLGQWIVDLGAFRKELLYGLDRCTGWSPRVRNLVRGQVQAAGGRTDDEWVVSRQNSWGTPIPMVDCGACGHQPIPEDDLPVRLPEDLDWSGEGSALAEHATFGETRCPACGGPALRETDTLDCFFDDLWCHLAPLVDLEGSPSFLAPGVTAWFPVDRFHSGIDTVAYLHLHRFFAHVFHRHGGLRSAEPLLAHEGHEMILARGRKMSNHLGNVVSPKRLVRRHGADAMRLAILRAAGPSVAMEWKSETIERAETTLRELFTFFDGLPRPIPAGGGELSRAARTLARRADESLGEMARFIDRQRPNAAIDVWERWFRATRSYATPRLAGGRLSAEDRDVLEKVLLALLVALSPIAPHLAEDLWHGMGQGGYVVQQPWPESVVTSEPGTPGRA